MADATERPLTYALDGAATGTGTISLTVTKICNNLDEIVAVLIVIFEDGGERQQHVLAQSVLRWSRYFVKFSAYCWCVLQ